MKEAYAAKKWAFVSDYARFWILYHEGGLYFDAKDFFVAWKYVPWLTIAIVFGSL